jgi:hypothetical protein
MLPASAAAIAQEALDRCPGAPGREPSRGFAWLCRDALRGQVVAREAAGRGPDRGQRQHVVTCCAHRYPLHRYLAAGRRCQAYFGLLRPRAFREPDQAAQGTTCLRRTSCRSALANQMRLILHAACSTCAARSRAGIRCRTQSSPPSVCVCSSLPAASSRPQPHSHRTRLMLPEAETFSFVALKLQPSGP